MKVRIICIIIILFTSLDIFAQVESEAITTAEQVLERFAENLGNVGNIEKITLQNETTQLLEHGEIIFENQIVIEFPDKINIVFGGNEIIIDGKSVHKKYKEGYFEKLPKSLLEKFTRPLKQNIIYFAKYYAKMELHFVGETKINDETYYQINIDQTEFYFDQETFMIVEIHYQSDGITMIKKMGEYQKVDNYWYPQKVVITDIDDNFVSKIVVKSIEIN